MRYETRENLIFGSIICVLMGVGAVGGGVGAAVGGSYMHECFSDGHICAPSALLNAPETASATELALLAELDKPGSDVDKEAAIQMLNNIRLELKTDARVSKDSYSARVLAVADEKWAQEKFMLQTQVDLEHARANRTRADTESSLAAQQLAQVELEWSKVEKFKMEEALKNMRSMKTLAMAMKEQHVELQNALKELDDLAVELPQADYGSGGGGSSGSKSLSELRERQTAYFSQRR